MCGCVFTVYIYFRYVSGIIMSDNIDNKVKHQVNLFRFVKRRRHESESESIAVAEQPHCVDTLHV